MGLDQSESIADEFWAKRIPHQGYPCELVYLRGQKVVRLWATGYSVIDTPTDDNIRKVVKTQVLRRQDRVSADSPSKNRGVVK